MRDEKEVRFAFATVGVLIFVLLLNILYLNYTFFNKQFQNGSLTPSSLTVVTVTSVPVVITVIPTQVPPTLIPTSVFQTNIQSNSLVKDYFIPLGSGTNQTSEFADVPGALAKVDFDNYQNIKEIRFEASVNVPTANQSVTVRLFNTTDKHPVWNSEVTMSGGASEYLISPPLLYDTGSKTYQVEMKTQLKYLTNLTQSRIHILLK
ncbi:MAG: hypothetical protein A3F31_04635 [Candidatus Levybacteria bacterium RIFCSPHIGHO2_12_FULL_38_12]|nr:MAG: hypothetical protein A2770_04320 [Candidatus Levybacteria bacterium RIFCSPHIGHO2_01_FULL_38_12]OGH22540.1 MAG: hypothetical protein A3F31_04635 [Candidatus Levybacteria bacterium RIFCSPHIGHO2_12_FULL_38_12]OGH33424.1 MAG: hypothetical protein A3A47_04220 [Candidatus Levybacteria bacterium RIFCSPLOWO2_01_FULL_37_20]OGH44077.1 MAG: hypothetical protein A3J14_05005 [Candidatus Levybacteria bacterium RIFCSPLOWO2_02_FULL_37_18]OGH51479.1 MAG: hypothetical protein A3G13_00830 [Candidatus Levy